MGTKKEYKELCEYLLNSLEMAACDLGNIKNAYKNTVAQESMTKASNRAILAFDYSNKKFKQLTLGRSK